MKIFNEMTERIINPFKHGYFYFGLLCSTLLGETVFRALQLQNRAIIIVSCSLCVFIGWIMAK